MCEIRRISSVISTTVHMDWAAYVFFCDTGIGKSAHKNKGESSVIILLWPEPSLLFSAFVMPP
jgi:hypothetical protein